MYTVKLSCRPQSAANRCKSNKNINLSVLESQRMTQTNSFRNFSEKFKKISDVNRLDVT